MPNGAPTFKPGVLVKSKAGGPKLIVDSVSDPAMFDYDKSPEPSYKCTWWVGNKRSCENFTESTLEAWAD